MEAHRSTQARPQAAARPACVGAAAFRAAVGGRQVRWPSASRHTSQQGVLARWGPGREGRGGFHWPRPLWELLAPKAQGWLQFAEKDVLAPLQDELREYAVLQKLLKYLHVAGEAATQIWAEQRTAAQLCRLEGQLRQRASAAFSVAKYELARSGDKDAIRADLLRPAFGAVTCGRIWQLYGELRGGQEPASAAREALLAALSGCSAEDATSLLECTRRSSELFAPTELAYRIGRQEWHGTRPLALGVALLPQLEEEVRRRQSQREAEAATVSVVVVGGCGICAALAARLGCEVQLVETRPLLRRVLEVVLRENDVVAQVIEAVPVELDVLVWEGLDEDTVLGLGYLPLIRGALVERERRGLPLPALVPARLRFHAAPVDSSLPRVRGADLSRFDRLRGWELPMTHRWPRGACHLRPRLQATPQELFSLELARLPREPELFLEQLTLRFPVEEGHQVGGVAFWVDFPESEAVVDEGPCAAGDVQEAWLACVHPLAPRRVRGGGRGLAIGAFRTHWSLWFEWVEDSGGRDADTTPVFPPISNTRLPPWQFKMLNDHERNRRYASALARAVDGARERKAGGASVSVLDCGCGAGLLSLVAARHGARTVAAVELSPIISDVAHETFEGYLLERKASGDPEAVAPSIQLFTADARALPPEEVGQHDVIACELMDASGTGESMLSVLQHACGHFAAPGAQVIPRRLELQGGLGWTALPSCHGGLDFSALDGLFFCSRRGGPFASAAAGEGGGSPPPRPPPELRAGAGAAGEASPQRPPSLHTGPFGSKNLNRLARGEGWDLLTQEARLLDFDLAGALHGARLYPCEREVELVASQDGVANALLWWWAAELDGRESLSNRPLEAGGRYRTHWHHPLVPLGPLPVRAGDRFHLRVSISDAVGQKLAFTLSPAAPGSAYAWRQQAEPAAPLLPQDPLAELLEQWPKWLEEVCTKSNRLNERYTTQGDLEGLASLQRAALAIAAFPSLFGCDPHCRDRLLQSYCGVTYK